MILTVKCLQDEGDNNQLSLAPTVNIVMVWCLDHLDTTQ